MNAQKASILAMVRRNMERAVPWTASMLSALERDGFVLNHVREGSAPVWFVRVSPPRPLQEGFGLAPEVLIIAVNGETRRATSTTPAARSCGRGCGSTAT